MADESPPRLVDTRVINKPTRFSGDEASWREWKLQIEKYVACVGPQCVTERGREGRHKGAKEAWNQTGGTAPAP